MTYDFWGFQSNLIVAGAQAGWAEITTEMSSNKNIMQKIYVHKKY